MTKGAISRKQLLKEPDQFITFSGKLIAFGRTHFKALLIGAGCFLTLLLVVATVHQVSERNAYRASEAFERVLAGYSAALQDSDPQRAYDQVKNDLKALFDTYGSKKGMGLKRIVYADISYRAGDTDTAIALYTRALNDLDHDPALKNMLWSGLAYAHVQKADYRQSIRYFEMIAAGSEATLRSDALFNLGWLYDHTGDQEKSRTFFRQLQTEFPNTFYDELIREQAGG